jgi:hypothetical protein
MDFELVVRLNWTVKPIDYLIFEAIRLEADLDLLNKIVG